MVRHAFRNGFRRIWIVRAATDPVAWIKEAVAEKLTVATERFEATFRTTPTFLGEKAPNYVKSKAAIVF